MKPRRTRLPYEARGGESAPGLNLQIDLKKRFSNLKENNSYFYYINVQVARLELAVVYLEGRGISQLCYTCLLIFNLKLILGRRAAQSPWGRGVAPAGPGRRSRPKPAFFKCGPIFLNRVGLEPTRIITSIV